MYQSVAEIDFLVMQRLFMDRFKYARVALL